MTARTPLRLRQAAPARPPRFRLAALPCLSSLIASCRERGLCQAGRAAVQSRAHETVVQGRPATLVPSQDPVLLCFAAQRVTEETGSRR